jgi:signal transduction histidine kinase
VALLLPTEGTDTAVVASEMRAQARPGLIGLLIWTVTSSLMWVSFRETASPRWLADVWLVAVLIQNATLFVLIRIFQRERPSDAEVNSKWLVPMLILYPMMTLMLVLGPWVLMRDAPPAAQMLGIALIPWSLAVSVLTTSAAQPVPAIGLASVALSGAAFAIYSDMPHGLLWAVFLLAACASMVALRSEARRNVIEAVTQQLAVEAAAADVRQALAVAAAERQAKARFIASASHDLKQPLAAARLWSRISQDTPSGPAQVQATAKADQAFSAAIGLVDSMIDHMRLEAGAEVARIGGVPVGPILLAAAETSAPAAAEIGLAIRVVPSRLVAAADPALLRRAIDNLVANAIRHSGGKRLLLGARRAAGGIAIWAIDDGCGVAAADQDEVFEDYAQGSNAGRGGFGIGLASVRRLLALMHGTASLDPRWKKGAAFQLWLPVAETAEQAVAA